MLFPIIWLTIQHKLAPISIPLRKKYESAKCFYFEDIVIINAPLKKWSEIIFKRWQVLVVGLFSPSISTLRSKTIIENRDINFQKERPHSSGGYILFCHSLIALQLFWKISDRIIAKTLWTRLTVMVATKGFLLANAANVLNVPWCIVRRDLKITEGFNCECQLCFGVLATVLKKTFLL